jgi:hypothetical protein
MRTRIRVNQPIAHTKKYKQGQLAVFSESMPTIACRRWSLLRLLLVVVVVMGGRGA